MKLYLTVSIIVLLFIGCCDDCCDGCPGLNCDTIYLGTNHLDTTLLNKKPLKAGETLLFKYRNENLLTYSQSTWTRDTFPLNYCDSSFYAEVVTVTYSTNALSPSIRFEMSNSSGFELNTISIGSSFTATYSLDSLVSYGNYQISYRSTIDTLGTRFNDVFMLQKTEPLQNDIHFILLDSNHTLLAFYQGTDNYWLQQ